VSASDIKPPFLLTPYHCTNWMPFVPVQGTDRLSVECRPTPAKPIAITTVVIAIVSAGFIWLVAAKAPQWLGGVSALLALTTVGTPVAIVLYHRSERTRGPVLIIHKDRSFELPRVKRRLCAEEVDSLAVVTATDGGSDWVSQIQICTNTKERILVATAWTRQELEAIACAVGSAVSIQAHYFKETKRALREEFPFAPPTSRAE
jgi:hypothetical protein